MKYLVIVLILLTFISCDDSTSSEKESKVQFSFSSATRAKANPADADAIVISIEQSGVLVHDKVHLTLFDFNGTLATTPLTLPVGSYQITEFFVVDDNDSVIYATPKEGSVLENLVTDPLPINFSVVSNQTVTVSPQVISTEFNTPADFGFTGLGFEVVETFDFFMSVQIFQSGSFNLTDALVKVYANGSLNYSQTIGDTITAIKVKDLPAANYNVIVSKGGFIDYNQTFTNSELKMFDGEEIGEIPLFVMLTPNPAPPTVSTIAGIGAAGLVDGPIATAQFNKPKDLVMDSSGNIYVVEQGNHVVRKITPGGNVSILAGNGTAGFADGTGAAAQFYNPFSIVIDAVGNLYVADTYNHRIRKITPAGVVSTLAGDGIVGNTDGSGITARFNYPRGLEIDGSGNIYVADQSNHRIRMVTPTGTVSTYAGTNSGFQDGPTNTAKFNVPISLAFDALGNLYVAEGINLVIRKISAGGTVSTFTAAVFNNASGMVFDLSENLYVTNTNDHNIQVVDSGGSVSLLTGGNNSYVDGDISIARFRYPSGIVIDPTGNLIIADSDNHRIRKITF